MRAVSQMVTRNHFKFTKTQTNQQTVVLDKFFRKNQNVVNKLVNDMPNIVSKGSPNRREIDAKSTDKRLVTRRMTVLNKLLIQCISDVLSTEQIGTDFQELKVRITQVKVNRECSAANIYWATRLGSTEEVAQQLDRLKGKLHQHISDRSLMNYVPWLQFVLDVDESHGMLIDNVLKKCHFGSDSKAAEPTLLETPYEKLNRSDEKPKDGKSSEMSANAYEFVKMQKPNDMKMDCLGLDYESLINAVLLNLNKSRAQHRKFNAVADPLPPPDWTLPDVSTNREEDAVYNTDERIRAMKHFMVENRKKKEMLSRVKRKQLVLNELNVRTNLLDAYDSYESNELEFEEEFKSDFDSSDHQNE